MDKEIKKDINTSDIEENTDLKQNLVKAKGVKTYRDFAINALKDKPTSLAQMVINEKKKEEFEYNTSTKNPKNFAIVAISIFLVFLGIALVAFIVIFVNSKNQDLQEKSKAINPNSLIYFDYKKEVQSSGFKRRDFIKNTSNFIENTNIPIKEIKIFYFVDNDQGGYKKLIKTREFLSLLETRAPIEFIKNLGDKFTYGIHSHIESNKPFLIFEFLDVDSVYTNMLAWEKVLVSDIGSLFGVKKTFYSQQFSDLNIHNKDTRVILNEQGEVVFGYSFIDLHHLVFFTSPDSLGRIVNLFQNFKKK